jgi:hypothetical protein
MNADTTTPDSRHESQVHHIGAEDALTLAAFGVILRPAEGVAELWPDEDGRVWADLGTITLDHAGHIEIWPRRGVTEPALDLLRGYAAEAAVSEPSTATGWLQTDTGWAVTVSAAGTGFLTLALLPEVA